MQSDNRDRMLPGTAVKERVKRPAERAASESAAQAGTRGRYPSAASEDRGRRIADEGQRLADSERRIAEEQRLAEQRRAAAQRRISAEQHRAAIAEKKRAVKIARGKKAYDTTKRIFDVVCSFMGLIALSPLFLLISLLILAERSGKHVFFKQRRLGMGGKPIYIYKFRTMVDGAEDVKRWLNEEQLKQYYSEYKVEDDPRVTRFGKFLRRTGLDELPQLLNILKGELSVVGPRPIQESETALYGKDKDLLLSIRPGLTGYWQAYCSGDTTYTNRKRQRMEIHYVLHRNFLWDIKICFATFGAIVRKAKRGQ